jgi:hypothetical protein
MRGKPPAGLSNVFGPAPELIIAGCSSQANAEPFLEAE